MEGTVIFGEPMVTAVSQPMPPALPTQTRPPQQQLVGAPLVIRAVVIAFVILL